MKKFINALIAGVLAICSVSAMAQNIPSCKHDVAPYDTGRYARDMLSDRVSSTTKIPVGTVWETNMKGGKFIVCRTTQERTVAILSDNTYYDIDCGNEVKIALPPRDVISKVTQQPGITTFTKAERCNSPESCKKVDWCDANNGWTVEGNERVCRAPGQVNRIIETNTLNIDQQLVVNPRVLPTIVRPWTGNGDFTVPSAPQARGEMSASQGPQINMGRSQAGTVSGQSCNTQGCSSRPVANFVSEVKASYCGIRTTDGRLFKLGSANDGSLVVADWTSGVEGRKMRIGGQAAGNDCDVAQTAVERTHWSGMTQFFGLPNGCAVTQRHAGQIAKN